MPKLYAGQMLGPALALVALAASPDPACAPLVTRVAAGAAPLGELRKRCTPEDVARAALAATATPDASGFATALTEGKGHIETPWSTGGAAESWKGRCFARVSEALPSSRPLPPAQCLADATLREELLPDRPEDSRANWLMHDAAALARWRACYAHAPAERCLNREKPLSLAPEETIADGGPNEARCRLALVDREAGLLAFRCEGSLVESTCHSEGNGVFQSSPLESLVTCGPDKHALVVVADLGRTPSAGCVTAAAIAARASRERFPRARRAALEACSEAWRASPSAVDHDDADPDDLPEDDVLSPGTRALVHGVLARQQKLFGARRLPRACGEHDRACLPRQR